MMSLSGQCIPGEGELFTELWESYGELEGEHEHVAWGLIGYDFEKTRKICNNQEAQVEAPHSLHRDRIVFSSSSFFQLQRLKTF